jgi:hypothetical protein
MDISRIISQPIKPTAPTPPPGGNIENRKPPAEPEKPANDKNNIKNSDIIRKKKRYYW